jgi:hypothetical protein
MNVTARDPFESTYACYYINVKDLGNIRKKPSTNLG